MGLQETALLGRHPAWAAGGALERAKSHAAALATALPAQPAELPATRGLHSDLWVCRLTKAVQCPLLLTLLKCKHGSWQPAKEKGQATRILRYKTHVCLT